MVKCFAFGVLCAAAGLLGAALPSVASAGAVFRCTGPHGEIAITNKPGGYVACTKLPNSDYAEPAARWRGPHRWLPVVTARQAPTARMRPNVSRLRCGR